MFKVIETFSGIGAQAKALHNLGIEYEIVHTAEWDINAIIAYYFIHGNRSVEKEYDKYSDKQIADFLLSKTLSSDGKSAVSDKSKMMWSNEFRRLLFIAIHETKNLCSITDVTSEMIPEDIDLFTYSFPCQDLSIAGYWHGNKTGISRNEKNRSGMLWEVERVLTDMFSEGKQLPRFLLMENVTNILSKIYEEDFKDWQSTLKHMGYINIVYQLNSKNFGIPQNRARAYMISVLCDDNEILEENIYYYFKRNDLQNFYKEGKKLSDILKVDYANEKYKLEADISQPNDTPSRQKIYDDNDHLVENNEINDICVKTITTKQDRNPNSGVIEYKNDNENKPQWRYLTPRECLLLMGFEESDYEAIQRNNPKINKSRHQFAYSKMVKLAGNSIVVNVLEEIFKQILDVKKTYFE